MLGLLCYAMTEQGTYIAEHGAHTSNDIVYVSV